MALNKRLKNSGLFYEKLGYTNADPLYQDMGKSADYMYIGFLTQISIDVPTERTLYSDFLPENAFTFTYEGVGKYRMYCNLFKPGYVEVEINEAQNNAPTSSIVLATVYDGYVEFTALDGGSAMDDILYNTPVKVKVWTNAGVTASSVVPVPFGFRYFMANDASCSVFTANTVEWAIDNAGLGGSVPFSSSWDAMMAAFYPVGNGAMIENLNVSQCYGIPNSYVLRTIGSVDPGMISVYDGSNNLVQSGSFNLITSMKCFVGLYDSNYPPGTQALRTMDFTGGEYSIGSMYGFDASDPLAFMGYLETGILQLINNPAVTATATNLGGTLWELRISNMYTNATSVDIKLLSTGIPVATLVETTC